jgi:hypothetical protein
MMTDEMKHEFRNMTENMDNSMDGPIGDIEDLAHMNGDGDFDRYSNLSHEMEDDEGRLIIAEEDQIPGNCSIFGEIFCSICKSVTEFDRDSPRLIGWLFLLLPPSERIKSGSVSCECANF